MKHESNKVAYLSKWIFGKIVGLKDYQMDGWKTIKMVIC